MLQLIGIVSIEKAENERDIIMNVSVAGRTKTSANM